MVPPHICLVEELVTGGSLFDLLHRRARRRGAPSASPLAYARVRSLCKLKSGWVCHVVGAGQVPRDSPVYQAQQQQVAQCVQHLCALHLSDGLLAAAPNRSACPAAPQLLQAAAMLQESIGNTSRDPA